MASDATRLSGVAGDGHAPAARLLRGGVVAVGLSRKHRFAKAARPRINLLAGLGVEGDAHCGVTVKHRSRVAQDPTQPNLRQVHLIHAELFEQLAGSGFEILPGQMGENITTRGIELLALPVDTLLRVGATAVLRLTGLRNPCVQLDAFAPGLMSAVLERTSDGTMIRKAGVMSIVVTGGVVGPGDDIVIERPPQPHRQLEPV